MKWLDGIIDSTDVSFSKLQGMGIPDQDREACCAAVHGVAQCRT